MKWLLKLGLWIFLFPLMLPIWLWSKGRIGKGLAGVWVLFIIVFGLTNSPSDNSRATIAESTVEFVQVESTDVIPTWTATVEPVQTQIAVILPTDTPIAIAVPTALPTVTEVLSITPNGVPTGAKVAQLVRVVDGDTIDVLIDGRSETVRYVGIDTPEMGQPGYRAASEANQLLLGNGPIYLVQDRTERDRYDRLLRYVYNANGMFVDAEMVRQGWAQPVEYPPDTLHAAEFRFLAEEAVKARAGFWSGSSAYDGAMSYGVTTGEINMRTGPDTVFGVSGSVPAGTPFTIFGRNDAGDWVQVRTPDRAGGWMYAPLLTINVPVLNIAVASDIPVAENPAPTAITVSGGNGSSTGGNTWTVYTCDDNPSPPPDLTCPIKGNISSGGQIYHTPGQRDYCKTEIDTSKGERWFCSAAEAEAAGWRAAQR